MRTLLLLPAAATLALFLADSLTARPSHWRYGAYEFDVVDASDRRSIPALVTLTYVGPLAGQAGSGAHYTTLGVPYDTYRGMTPDVGYGGLTGIVRNRPGTLIFRRRDLTITEGVRFRIEANGFEPFEFAPVDTKGRPLAFETWDPPVFRVELRRKGDSGITACWSTRPDLKIYPNILPPMPQAGR
jgi:hypothetical protein